MFKQRLDDISIGSPMIQVSVKRKSVTETQAQYDQIGIHNTQPIIPYLSDRFSLKTIM